MLWATVMFLPALTPGPVGSADEEAASATLTTRVAADTARSFVILPAPPPMSPSWSVAIVSSSHLLTKQNLCKKGAVASGSPHRTNRRSFPNRNGLDSS